MDWQKRLDIFMSNFEYAEDVIGILVCGSYVTGSPSKHSDLDVHIILDNNVHYRERGNKYVEELLIEYFANPPHQILQYFDEDLVDKSLMSQVQFATGKIILDKNEQVAKLKEQAITMINEFYEKKPTVSMSELSKYGLWDMLDDLQDSYETNRRDFEFLYFTALNNLIEEYMSSINQPYNRKVILGNIVDEEVCNKYLLKKLPNTDISDLIVQAILAAERVEKIDVYQKLTNAILAEYGGFSIDGFRFKSDTTKR